MKLNLIHVCSFLSVFYWIMEKACQWAALLFPNLPLIGEMVTLVLPRGSYGLVLLFDVLAQ